MVRDNFVSSGKRRVREVCEGLPDDSMEGL